MKILVHQLINEDIRKCQKKKWYPGIINEFPRVLRLLSEKGLLPGESPFHHLPQGINSLIFLHAGINLPGVGKSNGARIVYYVDRSNNEAKILYIGGHRDRVYNTARIVDLLSSRFMSTEFFYWSDTEN